MKTFLFICLSLAVPGFSLCQEVTRWTVCFNKKELLSATKEDPAKNIVRIKRSWLKQRDTLVITCFESTEHPQQKDWLRTFALFDENDHELLRRKDEQIFKLSATVLKNLFTGKQKLLLYTWVLPKDPALAAQIRIRRVHLCTFLPE